MPSRLDVTSGRHRVGRVRCSLSPLLEVSIRAADPQDRRHLSRRRPRSFRPGTPHRRGRRGFEARFEHRVHRAQKRIDTVMNSNTLLLLRARTDGAITADNRLAVLRDFVTGPLFEEMMRAADHARGWDWLCVVAAPTTSRPTATLLPHPAPRSSASRAWFAGDLGRQPQRQPRCGLIRGWHHRHRLALASLRWRRCRPHGNRLGRGSER